MNLENLMTSKRDKVLSGWNEWRSSRESKRVQSYEKDPVIREAFETGGDENFIKKIKKILLEKPSINKIERTILDRAEGNHHSKDFVKKVIDRLNANKDISKYILQVYHCEYDPKSRRKIIVSKLNDGSCCLRVYDEQVGYGGEIKLRCKHVHEGVLIAKYLVEKVNFFNKFDIKIDQKVLCN